MKRTADKSPFKFLDSYSADDQAIFFGREQEVEEVYDKVFQSKILLIYGASGTGKSSIINCGLANKLQDSDWLPIKIRRGGNMRTSMFDQLEKEAIQKVDISPEEKQTNKGLERVVNSVYLDHFKPIYLIFDQFEELFIFGFKDEWKDFISAIQFLSQTNLDIHFIFIIRGEYLEFLSEFEEIIPNFFDNRVRVEKMTRNRAQSTITGPAEAYSIKIEAGFEENLLKKLSPEKSHIELTFLQVFLDKIYKRAASVSSDDQLHFTNQQIDDLGQLGDVLAEFVDEQLFQMEDSKAALLVLKSFVSLQGTKVQKSLADVLSYCQDLGQPMPFKKAEAIVQEFVNKRILKDHDDNGKYELRHDSLAQKVFEKITNQEKELLDVKQFLNHSLNEYEKRGTLLKEEDISYISFYERNLDIPAKLEQFIELSKKRSIKRRRNKRTRIIITTIIVLLLITSIWGLFFSQQQKEKAEDLAAIAKSQQQEAETQKSVAESQKEIAIKNAQLAIQKAAEATMQKALAEEARNEANTQRNRALKQRSLADKRLEEAEVAKAAALQSEQKALELRKIAQEQKSIAVRLQTLAVAKRIAAKSLSIADPKLKALLALQALKFNDQYQGNPFDPDIYSALYEARKVYFNDAELIYKHPNTISEVLSNSQAIFFISKDGQLLKIEGQRPEPIFSHTESIESFAFDSEKNIWIGTQNGSILMVDTDDFQLLKSIKPFKKEVSTIQFHNDKIAAASLDGRVVQLTLDGEIFESFDLAEKVHNLVASDDALWAVTNKAIHRLKEDNISSYSITTSTELTSLTYSREQNLVIIGGVNGDIFVWDVSTEKVVQILSGHIAAITDLEVTKEGTFVGSSSFDRSVRLWPIKDSFASPIILEDHESWVSDIHFTEDEIMTSTYSGEIKRFSLQMHQLKEGLCPLIERAITHDEWNEFIGEEIPYQKTCHE